jgi:hypothetical protein
METWHGATRSPDGARRAAVVGGYGEGMRPGGWITVTRAIGVAGLAGVLGACSSPTPSSPPTTPVPSASLTVPGAAPSPAATLAAGAHWRGLPSSFGAPGAVHTAGVGWTSDDTLLYVVLWGSSSCPPVAVSPAARSGDGALAVVTDATRYRGKACTADLGPATTVVALPSGVVPGASVSVLVDGHGPVRLPAAGDSDAPVWVDAD